VFIKVASITFKRQCEILISMAEASDEQQQAMEKFKAMSPEEQKEFVKKQCIFCQISEGKIPSKKVYEDEVCVAVLDINPARVGHLLIIPKEHYSIMPQVPDDEIAHMGIVSKQLSLAVLNGMKSKGTNIFIANGSVAGQRAQHFMIHVIPRDEGDEVGLFIPQRQVTEEELGKVREVVQEKVNKVFGIKKEVVKEEESVDKKVEEKEEVKEEKEEGSLEEVAEKETKEELKEEVEEKPEEKEEVKEEKKEEKKEEGGVSLDDVANLFQ